MDGSERSCAQCGELRRDAADIPNPTHLYWYKLLNQGCCSLIMQGALSKAETASTGSGSDVPLPEDLVTCPITFEPYQLPNDEEGDDFVPYDPPCHHTLSKIALKDILAQAQREKWRCPTCQQALPSNDINAYQPNRFALGVLEAMEVARLTALKRRDDAVRRALDNQPLEPGAALDAEAPADQPPAQALAQEAAVPPPEPEPEQPALPPGWEQACAEFDVAGLGGMLQRFQAREDVVARHRNGLVSSGILSLNGRDTRVAVKLVLPTDTAGNADVAASARVEAAALAHATRHVPGAVLRLKGFLDAGNFLIAQEVPGSSLIKHLEKVITEQGGLKASVWLELMLQLIDCLRQLHGCGVIHCDISPASVVRSATGTLKLTDFSSARVCGPPDGGGTLLAAPVATFPSRRVAYLAPEQLIQVAANTRHQIQLQKGGPMEPQRRVMCGTVTDRTDIWSFAVFALHLWTGEPPTRGVTPDYDAANLPDLLRDLFMGCLHSSPEKRPSATEVYEHLCLVTDLKEDIPQFAPGSEVCVGVPAAAAPLQRYSTAASTHAEPRPVPGALPAAPTPGPPVAPPAAPVAVPAQAPAPLSPRTPVEPSQPPVPAAAGASPKPLSKFEQAQAELRRAQEVEAERQREKAAARAANGGARKGTFGKLRQMLRASS
eukprot:jgi/Ulvmu1/724/UM010_0096.1